MDISYAMINGCDVFGDYWIEAMELIFGDILIYIPEVSE